VASWTDANVSKESAALISQLHSAAYSKTPVTTVYRSPSRRHTQQDVNFEDKLSKKKKKLSQRRVTGVQEEWQQISYFSVTQMDASDQLQCSFTLSRNRINTPTNFTGDIWE